MNTLGETIRGLREEKQLPLRTVAAYLDIDQAILSKIERGLRKANREQVVKLAAYFKVKETDLLVAWLSDKLVDEAARENVALKAIHVAEERLAYSLRPKIVLDELMNKISEILKKDGRVSTAWLFGSIVTNKAGSNSDIDLMVELNNDRPYSMFDLLDIAHIIESKIERHVDLVEKGQLKAFALKSAEEKMVKIYG